MTRRRVNARELALALGLDPDELLRDLKSEPAKNLLSIPSTLGGPKAARAGVGTAVADISLLAEPNPLSATAQSSDLGCAAPNGTAERNLTVASSLEATVEPCIEAFGLPCIECERRPRAAHSLFCHRCLTYMRTDGKGEM